MNEILSAALDYCRRGFSIIPIQAGTKSPPRGFKWKPFQEQRPTKSQLEGYFGKGAGYGLAVVLGDVSGGLVCRDFDVLASYECWANDHPDLARTLPTVETNRGRHVYFRCDDRQVRQASKSGKTIIDLGDGELRGNGSYCLLPPTEHPAGGRYRWLITLDAEIPLVELSETGLTSCNTEGTEDTEDTACPEFSMPSTPSVLQGGSEFGPRPPSCSDLSSGSIRNTATLEDRIAGAIERALPTEPGQRHRLVFQLARELKAIPELADSSVGDLEPIVRKWHTRALPQIGTKPFEGTWFDFLEGWSKVKYPVGDGPVDRAFAKAIKADVPEAAMKYEQNDLRRLVAFCRELQRLAGTEPFFLDVRTAGRLVGVDYTSAWRWLRGLCHDGILTLESTGSLATRKANTYRYVAPMVAECTDA